MRDQFVQQLRVGAREAPRNQWRPVQVQDEHQTQVQPGFERWTRGAHQETQAGEQQKEFRYQFREPQVKRYKNCRFH